MQTYLPLTYSFGPKEFAKMKENAQSDSHWAPDAKKFLEDVEAQLPDVFKSLSA